MAIALLLGPEASPDPGNDPQFQTRGPNQLLQKSASQRALSRFARAGMATWLVSMLQETGFTIPEGESPTNTSIAQPAEVPNSAAQASAVVEAAAVAQARPHPSVTAAPPTTARRRLERDDAMSGNAARDRRRQEEDDAALARRLAAEDTDAAADSQTEPAVDERDRDTVACRACGRLAASVDAIETHSLHCASEAPRPGPTRRVGRGRRKAGGAAVEVRGLGKGGSCGHPQARLQISLKGGTRRRVGLSGSTCARHRDPTVGPRAGRNSACRLWKPRRCPRRARTASSGNWKRQGARHNSTPARRRAPRRRSHALVSMKMTRASARFASTRRRTPRSCRAATGLVDPARRRSGGASSLAPAAASPSTGPLKCISLCDFASTAWGGIQHAIAATNKLELLTRRERPII